MSPADMEKLLCAGYIQEAEHYAQALAAAAQVEAALTRGDTGTQELQQVTQHLDDVRRIESDLAETRNRWTAAGRKPGVELSRWLDRIAGLIVALRERIDQALNVGAKHKAKLAPALDDVVRRRHVRQAYGVSREEQP